MGLAVATVSGDSSPSSAESSFRELDDVFLQTQTRIWLGEVLHTRLDEQLNISDLLADGELLFEVSKVIWNMLWAKCMELRHVKYKSVGSRKSSGRYMPYSNVDSFLKICKILGLNGIDLFSPSDVVEKRDIRKVCICIRSLSMKARSKQLNVPDFDMVTYTITMPTNMVGCIRRSLELSQCSFTSSSSYSSYKDSRLKFRQKNSVSACDRNYDSCSEESDEAESNYMGAQSYSSFTNNSDDTDALNSDSETSTGVNSLVKKYTPAQTVLQSDIQDQEIDKFEHGQFKSACLSESVKSLCPQHVKNDHQLDSMSSPHIESRITIFDWASHVNNGVRHKQENGALELVDIDLGLGNDDSIVGDSLDDNGAERCNISHHLAFPDLAILGTDSNVPILFDGEDNVFNLFMGSQSHGSNSTQRTTRNGFRRRYSDDVEDVEVSSATSMGSVLGRVLNLDFDDRFDAEEFRTAKVNSAELLNNEANNLEKSTIVGYESQDMPMYEILVHRLSPDTKDPQFEMKHENFGFSTKVFSPCSDDWQSYSMDYQDVESFNNEIGISQRDSGDALWLNNMNLIVAGNGKDTVRKKENDTVVIGAPMVESEPDIKCAHNYIPADCCSNIVDITYEDSNASCNTVSVEGSEECHSNLHHQDIIIQDVCSHDTHIPHMLAGDNTVFNHNFIIPTNQCEPKAEKHSCCAVKGSGNVVDKTGHQACTGHSEDLLYCAEYTNELIIEDERKHDNVDILAEEISVGKKETIAGLPQAKPHRKPLLKMVFKGTALVGVLFLVLHLRSRSGREKTGEASKQPSQIQKSNGVMFSSRKGQKGGRVNGVYPDEKLKFGS